jgi:drug/metabolite transporter superfamily protein YnfA
MNLVAWLIFIVAAVLEVGGDATVRRGLRSGNLLFVAAGIAALGCYGLVVNSIRWDFSKLIGVYVAFFAFISILIGRIVLKETVPLSTWLGLALIVAGGAIIQFGQR